MISRRRLLVALLIFLTAYTLLMLPATGVGRFYGRSLCFLGNTYYQDFSDGGYVRFRPQLDENNNDMELFISRSDWKQGGKLTGASAGKASDRIGFLITAFVAALLLATPMPWKRKLIALPAGLLLITAFVMLKLRIIILHAYTQVPIFGLFQEEHQQQSIGWWYQHVAANATLGYTVAVVVWLGITLVFIDAQKLGDIPQKTGKK